MLKLLPTVIFEDADILVLNKPAGLVVHPDGRTEEGSVTSWLAENYPALREVGGALEIPAQKEKGDAVEILRYGIVHRIDRETSGILLVAKNQSSFEYLQNQFLERKITKIYHAFLYGRWPNNQGVIELPIGRSSSDFRRWSAEKGARGTLREAVTHFKVLGRMEAENKNHQVTFIQAEPKTGRTHQIRVHFKALQHPIVADSLYAPNQPKILGFERLALHARAIAFIDKAGEKRSFEAPYPADFEKALKSIGQFAK